MAISPLRSSRLGSACSRIPLVDSVSGLQSISADDVETNGVVCALHQRAGTLEGFELKAERVSIVRARRSKPVDNQLREATHNAGLDTLGRGEVA